MYVNLFLSIHAVPNLVPTYHLTDLLSIWRINQIRIIDFDLSKLNTRIYTGFSKLERLFSQKWSPIFKKSYILFPIYSHVCVINVIMILHNRLYITFERYHFENMLEYWFPFEILIMLFSRIFEVCKIKHLIFYSCCLERMFLYLAHSARYLTVSI